MKCAHCIHFNIHDYPAHKHVGLGNYNAFMRGQFVSVKSDRDCNKFTKASEEAINRRREEWRK